MLSQGAATIAWLVPISGRITRYNRQDFTTGTVPNPSKYSNWRFLFRMARYNSSLLMRTVASVEKEDDRRFCLPPASVLLLTACIAESKIAKPGDVRRPHPICMVST